MGDFKAFATAAHVGRGLPLFSQSLIIDVTQSSTFSLADALMASRVPAEVPNFSPMLYHFDLASQTASSTSPKSMMLRKPEHKIQIHVLLTQVHVSGTVFYR